MTFRQAIESAMREPHRSGKPASGGFAAHVIGFMCCLVLPAFWSAVAPVAMTTFTREDGKVRAVARTNLLFVVPFKTSIVEGVREVGDRTRHGQTYYKRENGKSRKHTTESEGFLVIQGDGEPAEVPVSPINLKSTVRKAQDFLADPSRTELRLFTVANWKFSVIFGAFFAFLALLYTIGVILSAFRFLGRLLIKAGGVVERHPEVLVG